MGWLQGCWSLVSPQRVVEEQWMAPRGRNMVGMGRTLRGDSLIEFEVVLIKEGEGTLLYEAHPSGQAPATFKAMILDVRRGAIRQLLDTLGKAAGKPREPWSRYTVEGLFDAAARSIQSADVITVSYDSGYNFPTEISGNAKAGLPDNWFWVKASRLTPLR